MHVPSRLVEIIFLWLGPLSEALRCGPLSRSYVNFLRHWYYSIFCSILLSVESDDESRAVSSIATSFLVVADAKLSLLPNRSPGERFRRVEELSWGSRTSLWSDLRNQGLRYCQRRALWICNQNENMKNKSTSQNGWGEVLETKILENNITGR